MALIPLPGTNKQTQEQPTPYTIEQFGGLDTKAKRPALSPNDFYWIENWIPIGPGNLRTIYDKEVTPIYTAANPRTIIFYTFYNIGPLRFCAVFLDDGTAIQVNTVTLAQTTISATTGKFFTAGGTLPHAAQYQSKYLAICSRVGDNAYWIWDGTNLFGASTLAPQVVMEASGTGYTSAPTVLAFGGSGSGATFAATIANGSVADVKVTNPGSGWQKDELITLVFSGGGSDTQARATATVTTTSGGVAIVTVTNGGSGYASPQVAFTGGGGTGAIAFVSGAANGVVTDITIVNPGSGYTTSPTVAITDSGGGVGTGATAVCEIRRGQITAITVNAGGSGYVGVPDIVISPPNDFGFPEIPAQAIATVSAGAVTAITLIAKGVGYKSASVDIQGGNNAAAASVQLMPYGIKGTSIETYQSRVWVADDTKYSYTGAASVADFSGAGGGGSSPVTDSFLREKVVRMVQANGFLYRMGDSSINVISNVQTTSSGVTTFNDSNVDPQIGTAWRDSVAAFGRALVFANPTGVYALYGGAAEKVSGPLDGLFANASFNTGAPGKTPTAAVATIFGLRVYCIELTTTDPFTNTLRDILCMWDGQKWFTATQTFAPAFLAGQEINSELTAYGASTTQIFRLFKTPTTALTKTFQTKLASNPSYIIQDQVLRVHYIAQAEQGLSGTLSIAVENQGGPGPTQVRQVQGGKIQFTGAGGAPIQFTGLGAANLDFLTRGLVIDGYDESMYGNLIGATVSTQVADLTLISMSLLLKPYAPDA